MEAFFDTFPKIEWKSIDDEDQQKSDGSISDYEVYHSDLGLTIIELKEIQDSEPHQKQEKIVDEIQAQLKGIFSNIAFNARFDAKNLPNQKEIADFKKFLRSISKNIISPCRIDLPTDPIYPMARLVEIQRLDHDGNLIERLYSPATQSGKYPRGRRKIDNFRMLGDPCVVIDGEKQTTNEEREIFLERGKAQISLISTPNGEGGSVYCQGVGGCLQEADRIRDRLKKAGSQLREYTGRNCPLGFVICPAGYRFADFTDLVDAILGRYQIAVKMIRDGDSFERETKEEHGGGRMLQHDKNTTISYCGWLDAGEKKSYLKIIHNDFSAQRLPYAFFDGPSTEQYIMKYRVEGQEVIGKLVKATSSEQLSAIRASNKEPIALMRMKPES